MYICLVTCWWVNSVGNHFLCILVWFELFHVVYICLAYACCVVLGFEFGCLEDSGGWWFVLLLIVCEFSLFSVLAGFVDVLGWVFTWFGCCLGW